MHLYCTGTVLYITGKNKSLYRHKFILSGAACWTPAEKTEAVKVMSVMSVMSI